MKFPKRLVAILLVLSLTTFIFGCVDEEVSNTSDGNGNGNGNGNGAVFKAMDVEITNIEFKWEKSTKNELDLPVLTVDCEAINYGGPGRCIVVIVAESANSSITMKRLITLGANEQKGLQFWGKIGEEPVNITSHVENELSNAITKPKSEEMKIETMNIFPEIHRWLDENKTQLKVTIYASVVNYEVPGHITLVVNIEGIGFTKTVEERIHIKWYDFQDLKFDLVLPGEPVNITISTKRPQPEE